MNYLFRSNDPGAPVLSGTVGALIGVLDAVLVNGYGNVAITSMTRDGNIVTVETSGAHGYRIDNTLQITGADQADYNGKWRVDSIVDTTHFTFDIGSAVPATPATGTMSVKIAPLGWTKAFTGTNKAAYRTPVGSNQHYLRIDDSDPAEVSARQAQVHMFETMTDVDTGTNGTPGGYAATKSEDANASAVPWTIYADDLLFYFFPDTGPSPLGLAFGEIVSYKPGDAFHTILIANDATTSSTDSQLGINEFYTAGHYTESQTFHRICRSYNQLGGHVTFGKLGDEHVGGNGLGNSGMTYPSPVDGGLYLTAIRVCESNVIRGVMPGLYAPLHDQPLGNADVVEDIVGLPGRRLRAHNTHNYMNGSDSYQVLFDITGPWR